MKITNIECLIGTDASGSNLVYVRTNTDSGIHGVGEVYHVGPDKASPEWVAYFAEQLAGQDPTEIERAWALCYQGARFPVGSSGLAALSAIDQSLWDITGKAFDKPVYELLGGRVRDRIRAYFDIQGATPAELAEDARNGMFPLLCQRQRKYGPKNITKFGETGIIVRMSDKVERTNHMGGAFADDSVVDAYMDLVGYAAIYFMLVNDIFELPLEDG